MKEEIKEQLSALVDGELAGHEHEFLLRRLQSDVELKDQWERYHLIRDALHNELPRSVDMSLTDRIMADVYREPHQDLPAVAEERSPGSLPATLARFARPLASLAVAASLAVLSLFGVQNMLQTREVAEPVARIASAADVPGYVRARGTRWDTARAEVETRLTTYLVNHNEYASTTNMQGMIPYVRIAGYDVRR